MNKESIVKSLVIALAIIAVSTIYATKNNQNYHFVDFSEDFDARNIVNYKNSNNKIVFPTNINGGSLDPDEITKLEAYSNEQSSFQSKKIKFNNNNKVFNDEDLLEKIRSNTDNSTSESIVIKTIIYTIIILSIFALCLFL